MGILDDAIEPYLEIDREILKTQLPMFRLKYPVSTTREAVDILRAPNILPKLRPNLRPWQLRRKKTLASPALHIGQACALKITSE